MINIKFPNKEQIQNQPKIKRKFAYTAIVIFGCRRFEFFSRYDIHIHLSTYLTYMHMIRTYTYNTFTYIFMQHVVHIPRNVVLGIQIKNKFPPYPPTSLFLIISYIHPLRFSSTSTSLPPPPCSSRNLPNTYGSSV